MSERRAMIHADHLLAVTRRCELLAVARSTVYYRPTGISAEDLALMRLLDEIHVARPFYGSRRLRDELETQGHPVNRKRVQRLVRQMGLRALYPKPRTSQPGVGHTVYPYRLRGLSIERPNQVWALIGNSSSFLISPDCPGPSLSVFRCSAASSYNSLKSAGISRFPSSNSRVRTCSSTNERSGE